jgi:hypothetical protein
VSSNRALRGLLGPRQSPARWVVRFLVGWPLDGHPRSDSEFFRRGTEPISRGLAGGRAKRRLSWWERRAGVERSAIRLAPFAVIGLVVYARLTDQSAADLARAWVPAPVLAMVRPALWSLAVAALYVVVRWVVRLRLEWHVVRPLAASLRHPLGWSIGVPHRKWLEVPRIIVTMPPTPFGRAWQGIKRVFRAWRDWRQSRDPEGWTSRLSGWLARRQARAAAVRHVVAARALEIHDPDSVTPGSVPDAPAAWMRPFLAVAAWVASRRLRMIDEARVRVTVPVELGHVSPEVRSKVQADTLAKIGGEWVPTWYVWGRSPTCEFHRAIRPPDRVNYAMIAPRMALTSETELVLGLRAGFRTTVVDIDNDAPHVLLSMGSGAGKSVLMRLFAAQALRKGWAVILLDFKQDHYWAQDMIDEGTPGLYYLRKISEIHEALLELENIRQLRTDYTFLNRNNPDAPTPQRVVILFEEMNITINMLRAYWMDVKPKGAPAKSPALAAFGSLAAAGRSACMNLVAIGQYLTAQVFGGPEARENFGIRCLARYSVAAWKTLVPEITPVPQKSSIRGRVQVCVAGEREETQVAYLTHDEVVDWAKGGLAGIVPAGIQPFEWALSPGVPVSSISGPGLSLGSGTPPAGDTAGDTPGAGAPPALEAHRRTLEDWWDSGLFADQWRTYAAVKKARTRDTRRGRFPATEDHLYTADEMLDWIASRTDAEPAGSGEIPAARPADRAHEQTRG